MSDFVGGPSQVPQFERRTGPAVPESMPQAATPFTRGQPAGGRPRGPAQTPFTRTQPSARTDRAAEQVSHAPSPEAPAPAAEPAPPQPSVAANAGNAALRLDAAGPAVRYKRTGLSGTDTARRRMVETPPDIGTEGSVAQSPPPARRPGTVSGVRASSPPPAITAAPKRPPQRPAAEAEDTHKHSQRPLSRVDAEVGSALTEGRDVNPVGLRPDQANIARGVAKVMRSHLDRPVTNGGKQTDDRTPPELADKGTIAEALVQERPGGRIVIDESVTTLAAAAKALDSTQLARSHVGDALAKARSAGKRVLPAAVTRDMSKGEQDLRRAANEVIARAYGRDQTRNHGPAVAPMLWGRAVYQAGKSLQGDQAAPGSIELAAGSVEGLDRSLHHSLAPGQTYEEGGVPRELLAVQRAADREKTLSVQEGAPREVIAARLAGVASDYAARVDEQHRIAAATRERHAAEAAAANQERLLRPARERASVEQYADTVTQTTQELAAGTHAAIDDIASMQLRWSDLAALRDRARQGDPQAADAVDRYEGDMANVTRGTAALMEHRTVRMPGSAEALKYVVDNAGRAVVRHAHDHRADIAQGRGVTPEVAKIVASQTPLTTIEAKSASELRLARTEAERKMVGDLEDALTDAAFMHYEGRSQISQKVGEETKDVRLAAALRDKSIPAFAREAYVDDLSPAPQPGERDTLLAITKGIRNARMYAHAQRIRDVQALPNALQQKYAEVMAWGKAYERSQHHRQTVQRVRRVTAPARNFMESILPSDRYR
jgi:hypothetical protein